MSVTKSKAEKTREVLSFLPRQDRHKPKGPEIKKSKMARWRAIVLIAVHVAIGIHIWHWLATGESMTPVEPSEAMETVEMGRINAGFVLFLSLIASTVIFGRWFCGWACHVVALQDLCAWLLKRIGLQPRPVRSRLLVFGPWVVAFYMFFWPPIHAWLWNTWGEAQGWTWLSPKVVPGVADWQWQVTTTELWTRFPGLLMTVGTFLVVGFLIVWWLGAKGFCTYGCPYGAFFSVAARVAPMRITVNDNCEHCGHCTTSCTSNVRVHEEVAKYGQVVDPGCMKCMDCVSVCPNDALSFGFAMPKPFTSSQQRIQARADFAWWEEIVMASVALVAVQWTFRGAWFGEGVPFLMAVGLGVITAVFVMLLLRLFLNKDVTFQHTVLKKAGQRSTAGWVTTALLIGWVLFSGHTLVGHRLRDPAIESAREPLQVAFYSRGGDPEVTKKVLADVEAAASWSLMPDPQLREVRAMMRGAVGRHEEAEAELTDMFESYGGKLFYPEAKMALAQYFGLLGTRYDEAEALLIEVSKDNPSNSVAPRLLQRVRVKKAR
ncbi:MAG: polyferredoxin [Planctomycetota bacterium]|jgi:polyferredoxin